MVAGALRSSECVTSITRSISGSDNVWPEALGHSCTCMKLGTLS